MGSAVGTVFAPTVCQTRLALHWVSAYACLVLVVRTARKRRNALTSVVGTASALPVYATAKVDTEEIIVPQSLLIKQNVRSDVLVTGYVLSVSASAIRVSQEKLASAPSRALVLQVA